MKIARSLFLLAVMILYGSTLADDAYARGGGRRGGNEGSLCTNVALLDMALVNIDVMISPTPPQKTVLQELKSIAHASADKMAAICAAPPPTTVLDKLKESASRTEATLAADRALKPIIENLYTMLDDGQKREFDRNIVAWPGL